MTICCIMNRCLGEEDVFERKEGKYCAVLMKHRRKVKSEQVITLQMNQQLKNKNIKYQGKNSNRLAFHLSAYRHL